MLTNLKDLQELKVGRNLTKMLPKQQKENMLKGLDQLWKILERIRSGIKNKFLFNFVILSFVQ